MRRLALAFLFAHESACSAARDRGTAAAAPSGEAEIRLSIVASNDVHGQLERLPVLAGYVANLRRARSRDGGLLLVDAGDALQGTIESNLNEGAAVIAAFNAMGHAAMALGNHEFDFGPAGPATSPKAITDDPRGALRARLAEARFPVLSANLEDASGRLPAWRNLSRSTIILVGGIRIGLIGLLTREAADVIKRPNFDGLAVGPLAQSASREATALRKSGAELVVVVAHAGGSCTRFDGAPDDLSSCDANSEIFRLARALPRGAVDVIVGGHRNAAVAHVASGVPIVHAPSHLVAFSRVDLTVDRKTHRILKKHIEPPRLLCTRPAPEACAPGTYEGAPVVPDLATSKAIRPALQAARVLRERRVGVQVLATFPMTKGTENALGNLFADLVLEAVPGADVAFGNAGSIRDVLPAGDLTFGQLHHVMPFDNQIARLRLTGAELRALVSQNLTEGEHGLLSFSGMGFTASCNHGRVEVALFDSKGAPILDDRELVAVTNDFLALGGDGLLAPLHVDPARIEVDVGTTVRDALLTGLARRRSVRPDDPATFDPDRPRIRTPGPPPVRCAEGP